VSDTMKLKGKKIGVLLESDFCEYEIWYYKLRFPEEGAEVNFLTRLWGFDSLTFKSHDYQVPMECKQSFEGMSDAQLRGYAAIIVPSGFVADRLRYSKPVDQMPPAVEFLRRAFAEKTILKGIICHGLMLAARIPEVVKGRRVVCHNNLYGDVANMGAVYVNEDVVVDDDLVTGREAECCALFARTIIDRLAGNRT
jgi:protease I